jgi:uncharacterized linocin/CFP29 family protein
MDRLRREQAPISDLAWSQIDDEAARSLRHFLAARPVVDFSGPRGWIHAAETLGRVRPADVPIAEGVVTAIRDVQPLVELRTRFRVPRSVLDAIDRGAPDADLTAVQDAARRAALAEDRVIFHGHPTAMIVGMVPGSPHPALTIPDDSGEYPRVVARAVAALRTAGVGGPYAIALGPRSHTGVIETTERRGYPVIDHLKLILGGPVVWAPAVDGAVAISQRGGDYELVCGQDFSVGYRDHTLDEVELELEESFTLLVRDPQAAIVLCHTS